MSTVFINPDILNVDVFVGSALFYFKFESLPLLDEVSLQIAHIDGSQQPVIDSGFFGNGLRMLPSSFATLPFIMKNSRDFTIGFWLLAENIPPVFDTSTQSFKNYRISLVDKSQFTLDFVTNEVSAYNATFVIFEECGSDNTNTMKILLQDDSGQQVVLSSPSYRAVGWHHFWFAYNGDAQVLDFFVDGQKKNMTFDSGSEIPSSLNNSLSSPLHINLSAVGDGSLLRNNFGVLDELFMRNTYIGDEFLVSKVINFGADYVMNDALANSREVNNILSFDDPSTIQVMSIASKGSFVYLGRNDGMLKKGIKDFWQAVLDYSNSEEELFVTKRLLSADSSINVSDGSLKIFKGSVKVS